MRNLSTPWAIRSQATRAAMMAVLPPGDDVQQDAVLADVVLTENLVAVDDAKERIPLVGPEGAFS